MKEIDFLPQWHRDTVRYRQLARRNVCLAVLMVAALSCLHLSNASGIRSASAALAALDLGQQESMQNQARLTSLQIRKERLQEQSKVIGRLEDDAPLDAVIGEISHLLGDSMAIRGITLETAPQPVPEPQDETPDPVFERRTTRVTVAGMAATDLDVGIFYGKLTSCPLFGDVEMLYSRQKVDSGRQVRLFELSFTVQPVKTGL